MPAVIFFAALLFVACSSREGLWRDQYIFIADDGTVLALGFHRSSAGTAEAKGWLGEGASWRRTFYDQFEVNDSDPADLAAVLTAWSERPGTRARVSIEHGAGGTAVGVRTPSASLHIESEPLVALGTTSDPEGVSTYLSGRGTLELGGGRVEGWLLTEVTPSSTPRLPFVEYGEFAFVVLAHPDEGVLVLKRSLQVSAFNHALFRGQESVRESTDVRVELGEDDVHVALPELATEAQLQITDRRATHGVSPSGDPVIYETLLLAGEWAGVAFVVRPDPSSLRSSDHEM